MNFRTDINGLRAIAVVAVVIFHFSPSLLPGGFAGVDVFFVISGFLMTKIILDRIEQNSFNLFSFYASRANRILPALVFLGGCLLIFGWFVLAPKMYKELSVHVASSLGFLSNIVYWLQVGYFSPSAHEKWLLHTWSLSVEWQFYLFYPLLILAVTQFIPKINLRFFVLFLTVIGFLGSVVVSSKYPDSSYYLLPFRAWEMLAGGVVYLFPLKLSSGMRKGLFYCGVIFILISYVFVDEGVTWPGYLTLLPVVGACFLLYSHQKDNKVFGSVVFQTTGNWSYSIYLWHWPIVVLFNYLNFSSYEYVVIGVAISFLAGGVSYHLIEQKYKSKVRVTSLFEMLKLPIIHHSIIICAIGTLVFVSQGASQRDFQYDNNVLKQIVMPNRDNGYCFNDYNKVQGEDENPSCLLGDAIKESKTLLFGDSFAGQYEPFWDEIFKNESTSLTSVTTNWCFSSLSSNFTGPKSHPSFSQCIRNREFVRNNINNYDVIIISSMWLNVEQSGYLEEVFDFIEFALEKGLTVIVMASPKVYDTNIGRRYETSLFSSLFEFDMSDFNSESDREVRDINYTFEKYANEHSKVYFLSRSELFNDTGTFNLNGKVVPYALDSAHISLLGSLHVFSHFRESSSYREIRSLF